VTAITNKETARKHEELALRSAGAAYRLLDIWARRTDIPISIHDRAFRGPRQTRGRELVSLRADGSALYADDGAALQTALILPAEGARTARALGRGVVCLTATIGADLVDTTKLAATPAVKRVGGKGAFHYAALLVGVTELRNRVVLIASGGSAGSLVAEVSGAVVEAEAAVVGVALGIDAASAARDQAGSALALAPVADLVVGAGLAAAPAVGRIGGGVLAPSIAVHRAEVADALAGVAAGGKGTAVLEASAAVGWIAVGVCACSTAQLLSGGTLTHSGDA
jgi:hypothetical protein